MSKSKSAILRPAILRPVSLRQKRAGLALGMSAALLAVPALAQSAEPEEVELDTLRIEDKAADVNPYTQKGAPYKARVSGDPRRVKPLAETPATIQVLTAIQIEESGETDLRDVLDGVPGVTVGTGENGNAFGDRYIIRGQEVRSDVFVDGLRDPGMTTRESFAVEQIEVTKGPSSSFGGRGTTGGRSTRSPSRPAPTTTSTASILASAPTTTGAARSIPTGAFRTISRCGPTCSTPRKTCRTASRLIVSVGAAHCPRRCA